MKQVKSQKSKLKSINSGQALILVLLGMAVVLTLVLSIVSRSITDIAVTTKDEDSLRAFYAAEAGVENAFLVGEGASETLSNNSSYTASVSDIAEGLFTYDVPEELYPGDSATVWFVSHDDSGNLACNESNGLPCYSIPSDVDPSTVSFEVCWGTPGSETDPNSATAPAIEFSLFYDTARTGVVNKNFSQTKVFRKTFDPNQGRTDDNKFNWTSEACTFGGYAFKGNITLSEIASADCLRNEGCLLMGRIKMFYNTDRTHPVGFSSTGDTLPSQGKMVSSTGYYSNAVRKLETFETFKEPLSIFESTIFSMGSNADLVKP